MKSWKQYLKLFITSLYISAFTFGGGYVIISLMKKKYADDLGWLEEDEMLDMTAIAQSTPGAVAVNAAILVGYKIGGILGAVVCTVATILPPLIIISTISFFYDAFQSNVYVAATLGGMQAGVAAVIADVVLSMGGKITKSKDWISIAVMVMAFCGVYFLSINVVYILLFCALVGISKTIYNNRKHPPQPKLDLDQVFDDPEAIAHAASTVPLEDAMDELLEEVLES